MSPIPRMYGESVWVHKPISCFRVSFSVNNLYRRQNELDTIPPAPTPRTWQIITNLLYIKQQINKKFNSGQTNVKFRHPVHSCRVNQDYQQAVDVTNKRKEIWSLLSSAQLGHGPRYLLIAQTCTVIVTIVTVIELSALFWATMTSENGQR